MREVGGYIRSLHDRERWQIVPKHQQINKHQYVNIKNVFQAEHPIS